MYFLLKEKPFFPDFEVRYDAKTNLTKINIDNYDMALSGISANKEDNIYFDKELSGMISSSDDDSFSSSD